MRWLSSMSAFTRVILGLMLGIFTGLFFGEMAGNLEIFGEAYIRLLQMTVLPYILVSLIGGLGRLNADIARRIGVTGGLLILLIWGITEASNLFLSLSYPDWTTASLFSTSLLESAKPFDPLTLYVPSNPFYSMANAIVPAIVVFSILLGVALISVPDKDALLSSLGTLTDALMRIIPFEYSGEKEFVAKTLISDPVAVRKIRDVSQLAPADPSRSRLDAILAHGTLRVGYMPDRLPFAYHNSKGEAVGYDLDLVQRLAADLEVSLELARLEWTQAMDALNDGQLDLVMGGIPITPAWATIVTFTDSHIDHTLGFVLPDKLRDEFATLEKVQTLPDLHIQVPRAAHYALIAERYFPNAEIEYIDSPRSYFKDKNDNAVLMYSVEAGSAWTLLYPEFGVVVPAGLSIKAPSALALPRGEPEFVYFMNIWLELARKNGIKEQLYDYWILGEEYRPREPRWSIMRNVLGWAE